MESVRADICSENGQPSYYSVVAVVVAPELVEIVAVVVAEVLQVVALAAVDQVFGLRVATLVVVFLVFVPVKVTSDTRLSETSLAVPSPPPHPPSNLPACGRRRSGSIKHCIKKLQAKAIHTPSHLHPCIHMVMVGVPSVACIQTIMYRSRRPLYIKTLRHTHTHTRDARDLPL